jgi:hypothetical protein
LADIHLEHLAEDFTSKAFLKMLSTFVRGQVHLHFDSADKAKQTLKICGFGSAHLLRPGDFAEGLTHCRALGVNRVRIIAARTGRWEKTV